MRVVTVITACVIFLGVSLRADGQNDWRKVEQFARGEVVAVATGAGAKIRGRLIRADADSVLLYAPTTGAAKLKRIEQLIQHDVRLLESVDRTPLLIEDADLRIGADGVTKKGVQIARFSEVFSVIARADVVTVVQPKDQRESSGATIAGVVIGGGLGLLGALRIALSDNPCQPHCMVVPEAIILGGATLGGIAGRKIGKPQEDLVIYRR